MLHVSVGDLVRMVRVRTLVPWRTGAGQPMWIFFVLCSWREWQAVMEFGVGREKSDRRKGRLNTEGRESEIRKERKEQS